MKKLTNIAILLAFFLGIQSANACTDFQTNAQDGTFLITRSMEFAFDLKSNLNSSNRYRQFTTTTPDGKPGLSWTAQYGYLFLDFFNIHNAVDGMNEKGLTFEYLYLPGETQFQGIPAEKNKQAIPYYYLGDWVLSNFKTVDEVRQALPSIYVFQQAIPGLDNIVFPVHAAIHDANGKGIVVEFVQGQMKIYDTIGVVTNSPSYDWHIINTRNYLNLSPYNPQPVIINGISFSATSQGTGMLGLPGDFSSPSRFIKIGFLKRVAAPAKTASEALNLAQHIINTVDIAAGISRAKVHGKDVTEITQWVVFKDTTHKIFYYRTYNDMTLRSVVFDKIDFSKYAKPLKMPLLANPFIMDMTDNFVKTGAQ